MFIPDLRQKQETCSTGLCHIFVCETPQLTLRLVLEDSLEKPIANAQCVLTVAGEPCAVTTTADGRIEQKIPRDAHIASMVIQDSQTPFEDTVIPIRIGDLDPVEEISGQLARLNNLGYFPGKGAENETAFKSAVEEFQCDHGLHVDSVCGPVTQVKLKQVHGC